MYEFAIPYTATGDNAIQGLATGNGWVLQPRNTRLRVKHGWIAIQIGIGKPVDTNVETDDVPYFDVCSSLLYHCPRGVWVPSQTTNITSVLQTDLSWYLIGEYQQLAVAHQSSPTDQDEITVSYKVSPATKWNLTRRETKTIDGAKSDKSEHIGTYDDKKVAVSLMEVLANKENGTTNTTDEDKANLKPWAAAIGHWRPAEAIKHPDWSDWTDYDCEIKPAPKGIIAAKYRYDRNRSGTTLLDIVIDVIDSHVLQYGLRLPNWFCVVGGGTMQAWTEKGQCYLCDVDGQQIRSKPSLGSGLEWPVEKGTTIKGTFEAYMIKQ